MSKELNDDLPQVDELASLKARADQMGLSYHPNIGVEKLREKVKAALESDGPVVDTEEDDVEEVAPKAEEPQPKQRSKHVPETDYERRVRLKREAEKLVRIRVTCMNPSKREWDGEIFTAGNSLVGSLKKYVPFNNDEGWHVPMIIYKQIKQRKCQIFVSVKLPDGQITRRGKLINEFAVEVLPQLTAEELKELGRRQAAARAID